MAFDKSKAKKAIVFIVLFLVVSFGYFLIAFKAPKDIRVLEKDYCLPLDDNFDEEGNYIPPPDKECVDGAWVTKNATEGDYDKYCMDDHMLIEQRFKGGRWEVNKTVASGDQYCEDGELYSIPSACGNRVCDNNETITTCPIDCGGFQDWAAFRDSVSRNPLLETYLEPEYQMDWTSEVIQEAVRDIKASYPDAIESPYWYQRRASEWLSRHFEYVLGGVVLCDERASQSLSRGTGNCIDYSIIYCSLLRAEGIPCKQIEGCVSNWEPQKCIPFKPSTWEYDLTGQVKGHSWVEMWIGARWIQADPTIGVGAARTCTGYKKLGETDGNNICRISREEDIDSCRQF